MKQLLCWNCGRSLEDVPRPISRHATCDGCFNELHCCRMCRHYDPKRSMQCFEDRADPPLQKENANFCDFFSPSTNAFSQQTVDRSSGAKKELDALFGSMAEEDNTDRDNSDEGADQDQLLDNKTLDKEALAKKKLDDLFK